MTLAKKHYHRLWFPEAGSGGDIASRAEHGITIDQFNSLFPKEFWREVVDRVAVEAPGTLLLAEAFWLMEGYFVRTLGMHRVYNSAFMNFMKKEENANYRESIKNVLEFDPYILERYVNFLNNPDEKTAIEQFGSDDKYFGVTLLMVTMPGLPMFGHGQIEGFSEKYGMEYHRAYWNESINWDLVHRHEREIFPLMHYRYLFAHVDNFYLYDFYKGNGVVDEDVFAYSNGYGANRVLVFYHNKYAETEGWIKASVPFLDKASRKLKQVNLDFALGIYFNENAFVKYRNFINGLEYVTSVPDLFEHGFFIHLSAYKYYVFSDFKVVYDSAETPWRKLSQKLNGKGIFNIEAALNKIRYSAVVETFCKVANSESFQALANERESTKAMSANTKFYTTIAENYAKFIETVSKFENLSHSNVEIASHFVEDLRALLYLPLFNFKSYDREALNYLYQNLSGNRYYLFMLLGFTVGARLSMIFDSCKNDAHVSRQLFTKYGLDNLFKELFQNLGFSDFHSTQLVRHITAFIYYQNWWKLYDFNELPKKLMSQIFEDKNMKIILQVNDYKGVTWFNKEAFEDFIAGLFVISTLEILRSSLNTKEKQQAFKQRYTLIKKILKTSLLSGYKVTKFLELLAAESRHSQKKPMAK